MKAKERLQKDIEDGKYCLGEAIVPKEYKKMVIKIVKLLKKYLRFMDEKFH